MSEEEAQNLNTNEIPIYESFEDMDLKEELLRGIYATGYEKPSVIQQKAIKPFLEGGDLITFNLSQEQVKLRLFEFNITSINESLKNTRYNYISY